MLLHVYRWTDVVTVGLLLDGRRDDGRVGNARLVEAVRRWSHHVRGETAGHQAEERKEATMNTDPT